MVVVERCVHLPNFAPDIASIFLKAASANTTYTKMGGSLSMGEAGMTFKAPQI